MCIFLSRSCLKVISIYQHLASLLVKLKVFTDLVFHFASLMATAFALISLAFCLQIQSTYAAPHYGLLQLEFDYVVVGSGPGGLTIASRLSEDPNVSVAVIEAGTWSEKVTGNQSQVPSYDYYYNGKSPNDTNPLVEWGFLTTPQAVRPLFQLKISTY